MPCIGDDCASTDVLRFLTFDPSLILCLPTSRFCWSHGHRAVRRQRWSAWTDHDAQDHARVFLANRDLSAHQCSHLDLSCARQLPPRPTQARPHCCRTSGAASRKHTGMMNMRDVRLELLLERLGSVSSIYRAALVSRIARAGASQRRAERPRANHPHDVPGPFTKKRV